MNRTYRFHSRWKAMKLYPRGTNLRRDTQLKLIMSDMSLRTKMNLLLLFHEAINSYCARAMREAYELYGRYKQSIGRSIINRIPIGRR